MFFCALAAFVVWQGVSIAWSIQPSRSWDYTNRGLVYFAFAAVGALVANVPLRRFATVACVLLGALFVWALAAKVIPGIYPDYERLARLRYPLGYWNELALLAAASVPLGLWAVGPRHDRRARLSGALFLFAALVVTVLTYSRVGIVLTVVAALVWLWLDRDRLAVLGPLAVAWIVGAVVAGVALLLPGVSSDGVSHHARVRDGLVFGAGARSSARSSSRLRRVSCCRAPSTRASRGARRLRLSSWCSWRSRLLSCAPAVPADFVSDRWHEFSNPVSAQVPEHADRIVSASSSNRWRWWTEAWNAFTDKPLQGTGRGNVRARRPRRARHAARDRSEPHSVPLQFLSEIGHRRLPACTRAVVAAAVIGILRRERTRRVACACAGVAALLRAFVRGHRLGLRRRPGAALPRSSAHSCPALPTPACARGWLVSGVVAGVCALAAVYSVTSPWLADESR